MSKTKAPQNLYIATYTDAKAADEDWETLKQLSESKVLESEGLALVNRDDDGNIHVKDTRHPKRKGATIGAVGGALVGLIFPPSLIATAAVGASIGTGTGAIVSRATRRKIEAEVEYILPAGGTAIVATFDQQWTTEFETALAGASRISRDQLSSDEDEEDDNDNNPKISYE